MLYFAAFLLFYYPVIIAYDCLLLPAVALKPDFNCYLLMIRELFENQVLHFRNLCLFPDNIRVNKQKIQGQRSCINMERIHLFGSVYCRWMLLREEEDEERRHKGSCDEGL